jgi:hypothetical protein
MTNLLDRGIEAARGLSPDAQEDIARIVLHLARSDHEAPLPLKSEEEAAIEVSKAAAARAEFAGDEVVRAACAKNGR